MRLIAYCYITVWMIGTLGVYCQCFVANVDCSLFIVRTSLASFYARGIPLGPTLWVFLGCVLDQTSAMQYHKYNRRIRYP